MQGPGDEIFLEMFEDEYNNEKVLQEIGADSLNLIPSTPPPSPFYTPLTSTHTVIPREAPLAYDGCVHVAPAH